MTQLDRERLDRAIDRGLAALWRRQRPDGSLDGTTHGGPLYTGVALVALALVGQLDQDDHERVLPWLRGQQRADGSFPPSPAVDMSSLDATAAVYAGLRALGLGDDDDTLARARAYVEAHGGFEAVNPMYLPTLGSAGVIAPEDLPAPHLFFELIPMAQSLMGSRFNQWVGMSANLMPLISAGLEDGGRASWLHPLRRYEEDKALAFLTGVQNPAGSLSGVLLYTAQLVSAFALMDLPADDPRLEGAIAALRGCRIENPGGMEYMPFTAEVWNTAEAVRTAMRAGVDPLSPKIGRAIDWLLAHQTSEDTPESWQNPAPGAPRHGGWPFEASNLKNPDCDTTGAVLDALGWVLARRELATVRAAVDKGLAWLLPMQNRDGGWPSMTRDNGAKPPGPMFDQPFTLPVTLSDMGRVFENPPLELQDPSTAAMSGRIMAALGACGLEPDHAALVGATSFLRAQLWHDRWWGRWEVNYVAGTSFGLLGLAGAGVDMGQAWVRSAAAWLIARQNPDGGWGEGVETYADWQAEGPWPSRADLTGKAVMALLEAVGPKHEAVQAGVRYLLEHQGEDGGWRIDDGLYVILPPDLFYSNPCSNLIAAVEALVRYRRALDGAGAGDRRERGIDGMDGMPAPAIDAPAGWTNAFLDHMRTQGDLVADTVVAEVFAHGEIGAVNQLLGHLFRNDEVIPAELPQVVQHYLVETANPRERPDEVVRRGEEFFAEHGPEIMMLLACYSLPAAYAAKKGVAVLYRTGFLSKRPNRRLFETAQVLIDVMSPGGLGPNGRGLRSIQKVRLMHAAIRHLLIHDEESPWDSAALGVPINQEDMAGTLMTFSWIILDGLYKLKLPIADEDAQAYLDAWRVVGHLMGVQPALIPATVADAKVLSDTIQARQIAPSDEGRALTRTLIEALDENFPGGRLLGTAAALMRYFLPPDVADGLDIPKHALQERLLGFASEHLGPLEGDLEEFGVYRRVLRALDLRLVDGIIRSRVSETGRELLLPDSLHAGWRRHD